MTLDEATLHFDSYNPPVPPVYCVSSVSSVQSAKPAAPAPSTYREKKDLKNLVSAEFSKWVTELPSPELRNWESASPELSDWLKEEAKLKLFRGKLSITDPFVVIAYHSTNLREWAWVEILRRKLRDIQALRAGWDGYAAGPIRRDVISYAQAVLNAIMKPRTPAPHITPMSNSGIMIEWHTKGIDLEIEIEKPGSLWVSFEDTLTSSEYEGAIGSNLTKLLDLIEQITKRNSNAAR